jgi:hypothetical protein
LLGRLAVLNQSVYYNKGWKRKFVSYCDECDRIPVIKRELVDGNWKYLAYGILEFIRNSTGGSDNKNEVEQTIHEPARTNNRFRGCCQKEVFSE